MDLATIIGLVLGITALVGGFLLEGGTVGALFQLAAFIIVFGGTVGAVIISYPLRELKRVPAILASAFREPKTNSVETIRYLVEMATVARREGVLALENYLEESEDLNPVLKEGLQLVIDGSDPELIKEMLEIELEFFERKNEVGAKIFETAGGVSPTIGIIGTVMGLIHVLAGLSMSNPEALGPAIALAFIATLYGVAFANIFYLPIANKLRYRNRQLVTVREMMMEGIMSIQAGENPKLLEKKLEAFLTPEERKQLRGGEDVTYEKAAETAG